MKLLNQIEYFRKGLLGKTVSSKLVAIFVEKVSKDTAYSPILIPKNSIEAFVEMRVGELCKQNLLSTRNDITCNVVIVLFPDSMLVIDIAEMHLYNIGGGETFTSGKSNSFVCFFIVVVP